jgi:peptidoglycan/xylan/chitin deacetylase (PgdA/CDA1 family)
MLNRRAKIFACRIIIRRIFCGFMCFMGVRTLMGKVFLTFDTEDFIWPSSISILQLVLSRLDKYNLKAVFFITGHMAEKLKNHQEIVTMLEQHEIGYHSSSHSVHPAIYEFTDVESYDEAYQISMAREKSHINSLTGQIEGEGGVLALGSVFHNNDVVSYRAPGFCWSPPHSEALRDMGMKFDFSTNIAPSPISYQGITFYPYPDYFEWQGGLSNYRKFLSNAIKRPVTVMVFHPSLFVYQKHWDFIYYRENPRVVTSPGIRTISEFKRRFHDFDLFLKRARNFQDIGLIEIIANFKEYNRVSAPSINKINEIYDFSLEWPRQFFGYEPKFLRNHFLKFFSAPIS